jgi:hypothetical protein
VLIRVVISMINLIVKSASIRIDRDPIQVSPLILIEIGQTDKLKDRACLGREVRSQIREIQETGRGREQNFIQ